MTNQVSKKITEVSNSLSTWGKNNISKKKKPDMKLLLNGLSHSLKGRQIKDLFQAQSLLMEQE